MNSVLQYPDELIRETGNMPSICLVLPFEPQLNDKSAIQVRLKAMLVKAESKLLQQYSNRKAIPVLARIRQLIAGVSYYNYKKSLALLATPQASKMFYLDFPVTEMVKTGESLGVRDIIMAKKEQPAYLLLVLKETEALMYEGNVSTLSLIRRNALAPKGQLGEMDKGLGLMYNAYHLPVVIAGDQHLLEAFRKISCHEEHIIAWLPGPLAALGAAEMLKVLRPVMHQWNIHKQQMLLRQLKKAALQGRLATGIPGVWNAANHTRSQLLVVEATLQSPDLDGIIEKVLKDEGEIEMVEGNALCAYGNIALIERHQVPHRVQADTQYRSVASHL